MSKQYTEVDGILIVDHGSRREQSNSMLRVFTTDYQEALDRRVVIIFPYFLPPGIHWDRHIPTLASEAAKEHPNTPYIGLHDLMVNRVFLCTAE